MSERDVTEGVWLESHFSPEALADNAADLEDQGVQPLRADGTVPNERLGPAIGTFVMSRDIGEMQTTIGVAAEAFGVTPLRVAEAVACGCYFLFAEKTEPIESGGLEWDGM